MPTILTKRERKKCVREQSPAKKRGKKEEHQTLLEKKNVVFQVRQKGRPTIQTGRYPSSKRKTERGSGNRIAQDLKKSVPQGRH